MNSPNAANTSEPTQTDRAEATHTQAGMLGLPVIAPTTKTAVSELSPRTIAVSILTTTYAAGLSGVIRSCRLQPTDRSIATMAPPLVVARIAPYRARLISTSADTLPDPYGFFA